MLRSPAHDLAGPTKPCRRVIASALKQSGYSAVACLNFDIDDDSIVLSGTVTSFFQKQIAQTIVLRHAADHRVKNQVQVSI